MGAAFSADQVIQIPELIDKLGHYTATGRYNSIEPLFRNENEYQEFKARHERDKVERRDPEGYAGEAYLGVDAGSTTVKMVLMDPEARLLLTEYRQNNGNPIPIIRDFLMHAMGRVSQSQNPRRLCHRLWRRAGEKRLPNGWGDCGNRGPFHRGPALHARGGVHHRYRRPGY